MRFRYLKFFLLAFFCVTDITGQYPANPSADEQRRIEMQRRMQENRRRDEAFARLRNISEGNTNSNPNVANGTLFPNELPKISKRDRQAVAVADDVLNTYSEFLKQKNNGVFRLHDASNCSGSNYIFDLNSPCPNAYPEKAAAYSFRTKKYQGKFLSDIFLENSKIYIKGFQTLGIISLLGELPLEDLTLSSNGVKQLFELEPPKIKDDFQHYSKMISGSVQVGDHIFGDKIQLESNKSYLLRIIAFKISEASHSKKSIISQIIESDKRDDIILVFKAVRQNEDKSWIIVWKELARKDAPTINF